MAFRKALSAALVAFFALTGSARAHDLVCDKTVNGEQVIVVDTYPTTLNYGFLVINVHPTSASVLDSAFDDLLNWLVGYTFSPPPPVSIPVGGSLSDSTQVTICSYEDCLAIAAEDGQCDAFIDNVFVIGFAEGGAQCRARVECKPCPDMPATGPATRTLAFFRAHEQAVSQCLAARPNISLGGYLTLNNSDSNALQSALGLLWGSLNEFADFTDRSPLETQRFLLARQILLAICNSELFGTSFDEASAIAALNANSCGGMSAVEAQLDVSNMSGQDAPLPGSFVPGPSTPQHAQSVAVDPTVHQVGSCTP